MRGAALLAALAGALVAPAFASAGGDAPFRLAYQAHSMNDLALTRQLVFQGVRFFKIDVSLVDYDSCANLSTWAGNRSDCFPSGDGKTEVCCLGFRGDTSSAPSLPQPFNTSSDLLRLLSEPRVQAAINRTGYERLHLNFDVQFSMVSGASLAPYAPLATRFMLDLDLLLRKSGLYAALEVDADFNVLDFADAACASASGDATCSPLLSALHALPFKAETGFPPGASSRDVVANNPASSLPRLCNASFPGHAQVDGDPYLFWEPSTQQHILDLLGGVANCSAVPPSHTLDRAGVRVTCNQDPAMFSVFASPLLNPANAGAAVTARRPFPGLNREVVARASTPALALVPAPFPAARRGAAQDVTHWAVLLTAESSGGNGSGGATRCVARMAPVDALHHAPGPLSAPLALPGLCADAASPRTASLVASGPAALPGSQSHVVLAASATGAAVLLNVSAADGALAVAWSGRLARPQGMDLAGVTLLNATHALAAFAGIGTGHCGVALALASMGAATGLRGGGGGGGEAGVICAVSLHGGPSRVNASEVALGVAPVPGAGTAGGAGWEGLLAYGDGAGTIRYAAVHVGSRGAGLSVRAGGAGWSEDALAASGRSPSVAALNTPGGVVAGVAHTDGLCEVGVVLNNGNMDHCAIAYGGGQPSLQHVAGLLNAAYAPVHVWAARTGNQSSRAGAPTRLSMCDPEIAHVKVDTGLRPALALGWVPAASEVATFLAHDGDVAAAPLTQAFCGAPLRKHGVTLDAWPQMPLAVWGA